VSRQQRAATGRRRCAEGRSFGGFVRLEVGVATPGPAGPTMCAVSHLRSARLRSSRPVAADIGGDADDLAIGLD